MPYVEGANKAEASARVCRHLEVCPKCRMEVAELQRASRALRLTPAAEAEVNPALWAKVQARLKPPPHAVERRWNWQVASAVAAAALVLAIVGTGRDLFLGPADRGERGRPSNVAISELKPDRAGTVPGAQSRAQVTAEALFVPASEAPRRAFAAKRSVPIEAAPATSLGRPSVASTGAPPLDVSEIRGASPQLSQAGVAAPTVAVAATPARNEDTLRIVSDGDGKAPAASRMESKPAVAGFWQPAAVSAGPPESVGAVSKARREYDSTEESTSVLSDEAAQPTSVDVLQRSDKHEKRRALFSYP